MTYHSIPMCLAVLILASGSECVPPNSNEPAGIFPVLDEPLPDPHVFHDGDAYYIFGTGTHFFHGDALEPAAMTRDELELDFAEEGGPFQIWAFKPYVHIDGSYHAYVTIHYGFFITVVAHFVPQEGEVWQPGEPIRRWRFNRILAGDKSGDGPMAYDPYVQRDADGDLYLFYCHSDGRHTDVRIVAQRMLDPETPDPDFEPRLILEPEGYRSEDRNPGYIQLVEAANLAAFDGTYLLLYSVGDFALHAGQPSNYKIGVAFADQLIPPPGETYRKTVIPDPDNVWGNEDKTDEVWYLLQSQKPEWPNYCAEWVQGPGVASIVEIDDAPWLVFHGYEPGLDSIGPNDRRVWKAPLDVRIDRNRPQHEWVRVRLPKSQPTEGTG